MIDTIRVESPFISNDLYLFFKSISFEKLQIDNKNNSMMYCFTNCDLEGSFDYKIMVQVKNHKWTRFLSLDKGKYVTELLPSKPYLIIEFSIHKFIRGHNINNGFNDLSKYFNLFVKYLENYFNIVLPESDNWIIKRLDYAETFRVDNVLKYIDLLKNSYYPRRNLITYPTSIMFPGTTTTVRIYSKEHEFKKHDMKRLSKNLNFDIINLLNYTKDLLRCEVQILAKKLKKENGGHEMTIKDYNIKKIQSIYSLELEKIFKIKENNIKYISADNVLNVLYSEFDNQLANNLFSIYTQIQIFGIKKVKKDMPKSTFYKYLNIYKKLGISLTSSAIILNNDNYKFYDFIPSLDSKYKVS